MKTLLETARLRLRRFRRGDLAAFTALYQDPAVMRFIGDGRPWSAADIAAEFRSVVENVPAAPLLGRIAVLPAGEPRVIGWGLLDHWEQTTLVEVGFGLLPAAHGCGLGRELASALVARARLVEAGLPLVATVHPDNRGSVRLLEALGFRREGVARREGRTKELYALDAPDLTDAVERGLVERW